MTAKHQDQQLPDQEKQERRQLNAVIGEHVMGTLGQPGDLHSVQVRHLWDDRYRVNVLVGVDATCARVANSYYLVADAEGNITTSTPKITRQY